MLHHVWIGDVGWGAEGWGAEAVHRAKKKDIQSEICVEGLSLSYIYIHIVCVCDMNPAQQEGSES